ncbi:ABC transporter ATP-binding protein [Thermofilum pendens]|uniref:ABC transporter related n=1 Tax=Thermofilum pendens (strain DSM 2475 / Hrk 5) TaxID=368408 RepID=A1S036_THEPD|nr:ABC transporter ATP-binding protein [Thermofilum pendens]ABL78816.1 ABC transporter related [Thermofilum pendens Hrk 5]
MLEGLLVVKGLEKRYGGKAAVEGLSFAVRPGEIYALLGPNGAGKTTTLKCVVGLLRPDAGDVVVCGHSVLRERREVLRCTGYVPENPVGFDYLRVSEFLDFVGALRRIPRDVLSERAERYISMFGLEQYRDAFMGELSRGTVQKVLVVASLLHEPRVLVMDEPMSGMDPESQKTLKDELRRLAGRGAAVLLSSHMLDVVERFASRVGIISGGRLIAEGSLEDVKRAAELGEDATLEDVFMRLVKGV